MPVLGKGNDFRGHGQLFGEYMSDIDITIITPSYNQSEFIEDTLDSVKNQTHNSVRHIVLDGGSDDGTIEILRKYEDTDGDSYDLTWISDDDDGQSDAINTGFRRAEGDIVAWLNSDDVYLDVNVLSRVAEYFKQSEAEIIYGDQCYINRESTITAFDVRPDFDARKLPYRILISQPATFFRQEVVESQKLDTDLQYSMDYEYWLRLSQIYKFEHFQDVLAGFRRYSEQKSRNQKAMADELQGILMDYADQNRAESVLFENLRVEMERTLRAAIITYRFSRDPPQLAFDGSFSPFWMMLKNLGPELNDAIKAWRRWRSGGASG
jgi:glycosyltransferase involved in cell wall biosynthesis